MAKNKSKVSEKRMEKISAGPTIYTFNFKDVPMERYAETIKLLFHDPNFVDAVEKRNALVKCAGRMKQNSQEMLSLIKQIHSVITDWLTSCLPHWYRPTDGLT